MIMFVMAMLLAVMSLLAMLCPAVGRMRLHAGLVAVAMSCATVVVDVARGQCLGRYRGSCGRTVLSTTISPALPFPAKAGPQAKGKAYLFQIMPVRCCRGPAGCRPIRTVVMVFVGKDCAEQIQRQPNGPNDDHKQRLVNT